MLEDVFVFFGIAAKEIEDLNKEMFLNHPYLLIGPGRWGSSDSWLGIPITWEQISGAKSIIEMNIENLNSEPSFGSHFFHNLTNLRIGYLTQDKNNKTLDCKWLNSRHVKKETKHLKWISLEQELTIHIDGSNGKSIILKEPILEPEDLNEQDSSGI